MNQKLGSKNGKNNRRLFFLNRKRKLNIEEKEIKDKKIKDEQIENKRNEEIIINFNIKKEQEPNNKELKKTDINETNINDTNIVIRKDKKDISTKEEIKPLPKIIDDVENKIIYPLPENKNTDNKSNDENKRNKLVKPKIDNKKENKEKTTEIITDKDYLEKQIIKILEEQIDDNRFKLKKLDSNIHTIEKEIDTLNDEEDVKYIEEEIEELIEKLNRIKTQLESLQKTFELDFPVEDPDNYLIYLIDEYIDKRKTEKELSEKLKQNKDFKSIVDKVIEIEEKQELIRNKISEKEEKLNLDNDQIKKMNDNFINLEELKEKIDNMINIQTNLLEEIKIKVNETVHITEKVDYITKRVNHSMIELFLLMNILKHNLSIKNNIIAAVTAKITLDMIIKMTTPITEKRLTKVNDVKNYDSLINSCLNDTKNLENIMNENLDNISSIRYTFEHDYKEYSYLDNYQELVDKLINLEEEMKERKKDIIKIKKETELQLEKNNAKVKKYGSMIA